MDSVIELSNDYKRYLSIKDDRSICLFSPFDLIRDSREEEARKKRPSYWVLRNTFLDRASLKLKLSDLFFQPI